MPTQPAWAFIMHRHSAWQGVQPVAYDVDQLTIHAIEKMVRSRYLLLRNPVQRGLDYLESHRNPYGVWRYQPRSGDGE